MYSMLYTVNLGLCDYVPFSQIRSHILMMVTKTLKGGLHEILVCIFFISVYSVCYVFNVCIICF